MRPLDAAIQTASVAASVRRLYLVRIEFDSGTLAWHSGFGTYSFDGLDYLGIGSLGSIAPVKEEPGVKATSISLTISGVKPEIVSLAQSEPYINRKVYIHCTFLDEQDQPLIATPFLIFKGSIDGIDANIGKSASFTVTVKSRLADWERPRKIRYTDADQQKIYAGDKFFEFVPQMSQRKIIWPRAAFLPDTRD